MRTKKKGDFISPCCNVPVDYYGKFKNGWHYYSDHCSKCSWDMRPVRVTDNKSGREEK